MLAARLLAVFLAAVAKYDGIPIFAFHFQQY
jgi:hypothetical protein